MVLLKIFTSQIWRLFEGSFKFNIVISCMKVTKMMSFDFDHKYNAYSRASPIQVTVIVCLKLPDSPWQENLSSTSG